MSLARTDLADIQMQIASSGTPALSDVTSQQVAHGGGWYVLVDDSPGGTAEVVLGGTDTTIVVQLTGSVYSGLTSRGASGVRRKSRIGSGNR